MRRVMIVIMLTACADPGRERVSIELELRGDGATVTWPGGTATLDRAQVFVGRLQLREGLDVAGAGSLFDDAPTNPREVGPIGAEWAEAREVNLLGSTGGTLGMVEGYEGTYAWASFAVGESWGVTEGEDALPLALEISGVASIEGAEPRAFEVAVVGDVAVVEVPVEVSLAVARPTARLLWTMHLGDVLAQIPWSSDSLNRGETMTEASPEVAQAIRFGLGRPSAWSLEVE